MSHKVELYFESDYMYHVFKHMVKDDFVYYHSIHSKSAMQKQIRARNDDEKGEWNI